MDITKRERPFTIIVEGNIGCGKSTLIKLFSQNPEIDILPEPLEKWCNLEGHNLLQMMYEDPCRHSMTLQSYIQLTMAQNHCKGASSPITKVKIMERSIFSAQNIFVENLWKNKKLADSEYEVLSAWYKFLTTSESVDLKVDLIVYLRVAPEVAWERVKKRARSEEDTVSLEYLTELHELHEKWLMSSDLKLSGPIMVVDVNKSFEELPIIHREVKKKIYESMEQAGVNLTKKDKNCCWIC